MSDNKNVDKEEIMGIDKAEIDTSVDFEAIESEENFEKNKESEDSSEDNSDVVLGDDEDFEIIEDDDVVAEKIDRHRKKKRIKLTIISIVVLIVCSMGCYLFIDQRAQLDRFDASLHNNSYKEAIQLYNSLMDSQKSKADMMVESKVQDIYKTYYKGSLSIEKSLAELDKLAELDSGAKEKINKMKELFAILKESEKNFAKGQKAYEDDELKNSIIYYGKVIKKDTHYKAANTKLKKIATKYRKQEIARAQKCIDEDDDYDSAIKIMYDYLKLLSKDKVAIEQLQKYKSEKLNLSISDIEDSVDVKVKKQDYVGAIGIVKDAINEYGEDKRLVDMLPDLVENMYEQVEKYIKSDRYTTAVSTLKEYLNIVKTDEKASGLIKDYSSKVTKGKPLSSIKANAQEGKFYVIDELSEYKDANGNKYDDVVEVVGYRNLDTKGKLEYNNDGYSTLTGSIGYVNSKDIEYYKDGSGKIFISGDGKILFTSDEITATSKNQEVNIDIAKYKKITIEWKPINSSNIKMYNIVLGNFTFVK